MRPTGEAGRRRPLRDGGRIALSAGPLANPLATPRVHPTSRCGDACKPPSVDAPSVCAWPGGRLTRRNSRGSATGPPPRGGDLGFHPLGAPTEATRRGLGRPPRASGGYHGYATAWSARAARPWPVVMTLRQPVARGCPTRAGRLSFLGSPRRPDNV